MGYTRLVDRQIISESLQSGGEPIDILGTEADDVADKVMQLH